MRVDVSIPGLVEKLITNGFARRNHLGTVLAIGKTNMIHLSHFDIIRFFNSKITGLLSAFSFAGNFANLNKVCWILRQSCALTLARKFKLKTMSKAFGAYGFDLKDPDTDVKLNIPTSFKAKYDYKLAHRIMDQEDVSLEDVADKILSKA